MPDSPTVEQITENTHRDEIIELATRLFPEDGHETDAENTDSSVFQLLCEVTRVYTRLITDHEVTERDQAFTLQSVMENLAPSFVI